MIINLLEYFRDWKWDNRDSYQNIISKFEYVGAQNATKRIIIFFVVETEYSYNELRDWSQETLTKYKIKLYRKLMKPEKTRLIGYIVESNVRLANLKWHAEFLEKNVR